MKAPCSLILMLLLSAGLPARADEASRFPGRSDEEVARRLGFIEARLAAGTPAANRWSYGWLSAYGALTVGQFGAVFATTNPGLRKDLAVGAFSSSLGALPFALFPFTPRFASAELGRWPASTPAERRRKLSCAEGLLRKSAADEARGRSWMTHLGTLGVNIAFGVVLIAGYHRDRSGINSMIIGTGVGEIQIFTQPTDAIDDWTAYSKGDLRSVASQSGVRFELVAAPGGLGLDARF